MSGPEGYNLSIKHPEPSNPDFALILQQEEGRPDKSTAELRINYAWAYWNYKQRRGVAPNEDTVMGSRPRAEIRAAIDGILADAAHHAMTGE